MRGETLHFQTTTPVAGDGQPMPRNRLPDPSAERGLDSVGAFVEHIRPVRSRH